MATNTTSAKQFGIPPDDPKRKLAIAQPDSDQNIPHVGVVGDTYTTRAAAVYVFARRAGTVLPGHRRPRPEPDGAATQAH